MVDINNVSNVGYSKVSDTLLTPSVLNSTISDVLLKGNQAAFSVDSTVAVDVVVSADLWKQAQYAQILVNNVAGTNAIDLVGGTNANDDVNVGAIQEALGITQPGAVAALKIFRSGATASTITLQGQTAVESTGYGADVYLETVAYNGGTGHVLVRRTDLLL